jgi:hypothetical protein
MNVALLDCVFPEAPRPVYKKATRLGLLLTLVCIGNPSFFKTSRLCSSASEIWPASSRPCAATDGT